jgi:small subunit ribosomal protein S17
MAEETTTETTEKGGKAAPATGRGRPKTRVGIVTSNKMRKTVVVTVSRRAAHRQYGKIVSLREKYKAHVEDHDYPKKISIHEGDRVRIAETRPMSKDKRWRVVEVLEKGSGT